MAKRLIDTTIWETQQFMELPPRLKLAWFYLFDTCNDAGVWNINIRLMNFQICSDYTLDEILSGLGDYVELLSPTLLIIKSHYWARN